MKQNKTQNRNNKFNPKQEKGMLKTEYKSIKMKKQQRNSLKPEVGYFKRSTKLIKLKLG